jgi:mRNA interferase MazF
VKRGEIWWADLSAPHGSEPGYRRPVLVVQQDDFNQSRISAVIAVALTSNLRLSEAPGNILLKKRWTRLPKDSVANVSQIITLDKSLLAEHVGKLPQAKLELIPSGIDVVLGR